MDSLPPRPPTVERVVAHNANPLPPLPPLAVLAAEDLANALALPGAVLLDGRTASEFEVAHLPGSINLPLSGTGLGTRAGWVVEPEAPIVALANSEDECAELARRLRAVAIDGVVGIAPGGAGTLREAGLELHHETGVTVADLAQWLDDFTVVDVRDLSEWEAGHLTHSVHLPLHRLREPEGLESDRPLAIACASGNRAAFAASWLRRQGYVAHRLTDGGISDLALHGVDLVGA